MKVNCGSIKMRISSFDLLDMMKKVDGGTVTMEHSEQQKKKIVTQLEFQFSINIISSWEYIRIC